MKCYVTDNTRRFEEVQIKPRYSFATPEMRLIKVYPQCKHQSVIGFGGALTESSAYVFSKMPPKSQEQFLNLYFGKGGNDYSFCRLVIQSCDFSLSSRSYLDSGSDSELSSFSIDEDRRYVIPLIHAALRKNPDIAFLASPWSPPAWAKTNRNMCYGGRLRRSKYEIWAKIIARYVEEYGKEGIHIGWVTVQNEPQARQTWESCIFKANQEIAFAGEFLRPALDAAGLNKVRILIWDHNKERILERAVASVESDKAEAIDGVAFHWYSGDHFEALAESRRVIGPQRDLIFTEGCEAFSAGDHSRDISYAEHYARELIGDLNAGSNGILDWNIVLDDQGGPNHVGNFCDAPVMYDAEEDILDIRLSYYYLGHFSRFIRPNARRVLVSSFTKDLMTCGFDNNDGTIVVIVLNTSESEIPFELLVEKESILPNKVYTIKSKPHSIISAIIA